MSGLQKLYVRDPRHVTTPVCIPGESYSFVINDTYFSDPNRDALELQIRDVDDNLAASGFATLLFVNPFFTGPLFQIYSTYPFPRIANGYYQYAIYSNAESRVVLRSNPILVESEITDTTMILEVWNDSPIYGIPYDLLIGPVNAFKQRVRLSLSQIDEQFESEKTTYRNVTDRKLRNLKNYRDRNVKVEARLFDDDAFEALTAALEHEHVEIDGLTLEPKTGVSTATNQISNLNKGTFEAYANSPETQHGIFAGYGNTIILCGDPDYNPTLIYQA